MEADLLHWLRERLPTHPLLKLGIGDDAAILATAGRGDVVVTTDLIAEGVDFNLAVDSPRRIGHKALAINLSDLAAMAAQPLAAVIALNLPRRDGHRIAVELYEGLLPLAERYHVAIAGGDTNSWDGPLVVSVTAFGEVTPDGPLCRGGAKPGDRIVVTGSFGGSILGRHLDIEPRVKESLLLNQRYRLHAAIDSSDGLSLDLWRICQASSLGAVVNVDRVPIAPAAYELAKRGGNDTKAITHALADGEDFELILAAPADSAAQMLGDQPLEGVLLSEIGEFCAEQRLLQQNSKGERKPLEPRGFEHPLD